ncbi:hypothetical protein E3N88_32346 [Mikania micrantha]|uniref:Uncharacterized protein n=1 Tax=Mikania micrantha TaxID=192012 RepID=A0A5N6M8R8_9ASTR|nr:hypothetical protein E3N88_32346 [Mikania micrantha]
MRPVAVRDNPIAKGSAIRDENWESRLPNLIAAIEASRKLGKLSNDKKDEIQPLEGTPGAVQPRILSSKELTSRNASFHSRKHHINRNCFTSPTVVRRMATPTGGWNSA